MSCNKNKIKHNCGSIEYASCIRYEDTVSANSSLDPENDCLSLEETTKDIYEQLDDINSRIAEGENPPSEVVTVFGRAGAVTAQSGDYTTAQVTEATNKRYLNDAEKVKVQSIDQAVSSSEKITWNGKQSALGYVPVPETRTINSLPLSSNITLTKGNIGLGNVQNIDTTIAANITQTASYRFVTDAEKATWNAAGASYWEAGTGTNATVLIGGGNTADGDLAVAEGIGNIALGNYSHAEGKYNEANGEASHAEGWNTYANGEQSHAEGIFSEANGDWSHAEGSSTTAGGVAAHSEGESTYANGDWSHAQNFGTIASGDYSHAGGQGTVASGTNSFVHGDNSTASNTNTIVLGANITGTEADATYVNKLIAGATVRLKAYTVSTLPVGVAGDIAYVTDALTPTYHGVVASGGAVICQVFYNGTNWTT